MKLEQAYQTASELQEQYSEQKLNDLINDMNASGIDWEYSLDYDSCDDRGNPLLYGITIAGVDYAMPLINFVSGLSCDGDEYSDDLINFVFGLSYGADLVPIDIDTALQDILEWISEGYEDLPFDLNPASYMDIWNNQVCKGE